jgi:hypothetical protein
MEMLIVFLVFAVPLLSASIFSAIQGGDKRISALHRAIFTVNIFLQSIGPLAVSILLLQKAQLPLFLSVITMAGFVPSAGAFSLWFVLTRKPQDALVKMSAPIMTILNLIWPFALMLLLGSEWSSGLTGLFSYEFLSLAVGFFLILTFGHLLDFQERKTKILAYFVLSAVFIGPAAFYEYWWLIAFLKSQPHSLNLLDYASLPVRYTGLIGYGYYLFGRLRNVVV